jgi:hypothetical protein
MPGMRNALRGDRAVGMRITNPKESFPTNASSRTRTLDPLIKSQRGTLANKGLTIDPPHMGPHSAAESTRATPTDPALAAIVSAWPDLPPAIRAGIAAMVNAARPRG